MTATVIEGAAIVDGTGAEPVLLDIRFDETGILEIGSLVRRRGDVALDATGLLVMPGFIDTHVHAGPIVGSPAVEALVAQGVTTVVLGGDGFAYGGATKSALRFTEEYFGGIDGAPPPGADGSAEWFLEGQDPFYINVGLLVPANAVRHAVIGSADRAPSPAELEIMVDLVHQGLTQGALGLATGMEYIPGCFAGDDEVAALCAPVTAWGGVHASHMRGYGDGVAGGLAGLAQIQRESGVRTHVAHLRGTADSVLHALTAEDLSATFDSYPYQQGCTLISMKVIPRDAQTRSTSATLDWVRTSSAARLMAQANPELGSYVLASSGSFPDSPHAGRSLQEAADVEGVPLGDFVQRLLSESALRATCIVPAGPGQDTEEDYARLIQDDRSMACSDGIYIGEHPHPRGWGSFARVLARHVRERGDLTLGRAAQHLAGRAARTFGLTGRGRIARGYHADLVVLDPSVIADRATYATPRALASGVERVYVNGTEIFAHGALTGTRAGQAMKSSRGGRR